MCRVCEELQHACSGCSYGWFLHHYRTDDDRLTVRWRCGGVLWAEPVGVCCCSEPPCPYRCTGWDTEAPERSWCPPTQNLNTQTAVFGLTLFYLCWKIKILFIVFLPQYSIYVNISVCVSHHPRSGSRAQLHPVVGSLGGRQGSGSEDSPSQFVGSEATLQTKTGGSHS